MTIRQTHRFLGLLVLATLFLISSCNKEDRLPALPSIDIVHLGVHDAEHEGVFFLGEEGHFEVNISAPGGIEKIDLEILQKSGYGNFTLTHTYTGDYTGKQEVIGFQDYPLIPEGQGIGIYRFRLQVTDLRGQTAVINRDITVEPGRDDRGEHMHEH